MNPDVPQKNLESAIKLYDELEQVTKIAGKEAEFLQLSLKLKIKKEVLDSVNNDLKTLYNEVVDQTQSNKVKDNTPVPSSTSDVTDGKFDNTVGDGTMYKQATRLASRQERKLEKIDNFIKRKLDINGVDGLVAAVNQLNQEVRSQYPELFKAKFEEKTYNQNKENSSQQPQTAEQVIAASVQKLATSKDPESLLGAVSHDIDKIAKKTLIDKAGWSQGAVDVAKIFGGIYLGIKALGAANDAFPGGLEGFMLKLVAGYSAYVGYDKYKGDILKGYKKLTKQESKNSTTKNNELSHRDFESKEFKNGEAWIKALTGRFTGKQSTVLGSYNMPGGFDLGQLIADYSGKEFVIGGVKKTPNKTQTDDMCTNMEFESTKCYDLVAQMDSEISKGSGSNYQIEINAYLTSIGATTKDLTIQGFGERFSEYENIQKVRYNILKKAGYEVNIKGKDMRLQIDEKLKIITGKNIKDISKDFELNEKQISQLQSLIDDGTLIEVGTTGAANFKINDELGKLQLSNITNKQKTINAIKQGFTTIVSTLPEGQRKFIRLVVDSKGVLSYQHDQHDGLLGVKVPIQIGGDKNISLLSLAGNNQNSDDSQGWHKIFEMAEYETNLIQLYAGQANSGTKEYFVPTGIGSIKFNGADISNRLVKGSIRSNPFADIVKVPVLLSLNHNAKKAIQDYCKYLNNSTTYGSKVWEQGLIPEGYDSIEPGVTGLRQTTNVGGDITKIKASLMEISGLAQRIDRDLLITKGQDGEIIVTRKSVDGRSPMQMKIVQSPNNSDRWSLQYYSNDKLTNFPKDLANEGLESADKCIRLADELLGIQLKCKGRANSQFRDPFFLKTEKTTALGGVKLWNSDGDRGIYFINDRNHDAPYENTNDVKKSFETAEPVLTQDTLGSISPKFTDMDGYIVGMINNMSYPQGKSQWFLSDRPKDNPKIVYETILGKTLKVVDDSVRGTVGRLWGLAKDAGDEVVETAGNVGKKFTNRVKELVDYQDQPENLSERLKQLKIDGLSKEEIKEKTLLSIITYKSFAPLYAMVQSLMNDKQMDFATAYLKIFGRSEPLSVLRIQLNREVAIAMKSNPTIFKAFGSGVNREDELMKYFNTHVHDIDFGMMQKIKTALGNLKEGAIDQRELVMNKMTTRTGEGTWIGKLLENAKGTALGLGGAFEGGANFIGGVGSVFGALGNIASFFFNIFK